MARNSGRSLASHAYLTLSRDSSVSIKSTQHFFLLLKLINTIFESSESFKQLLHFLVSDHRNSPRPVQTTRDGLPAGDRPSENTLSSALLYRQVRSNLRESGEIVVGLNTYQLLISV